jgi:hypothetical protein
MFSVKEADNSANFAAGGIINRRTTQLTLQRQKH